MDRVNVRVLTHFDTTIYTRDFLIKDTYISIKSYVIKYDLLVENLENLKNKAKYDFNS